MLLYLPYLAVKLVKNGATNRSKGFAFIQYTCQEDAMLALETMDNKVLLCLIPPVFLDILTSKIYLL